LSVKSIPNLDSLEKTLIDANDDAKLYALAELAWYYRNIKPSKSIAFAQEGLDLANRKSLLNYKTEFNATIGANFLILGNFDAAISHYLISVKNAAKLKDSISMADYYNNIGVAYKGKNLLDSAIYYYSLAGKFYQKSKLPSKVSVTYTNLASIYESLNKYDLAFNYNEKSLKIKIKTKDTAGMATVYNNIALLYQQKKEYGKADDYLRKTLALSRAIGDSNGVVTAMANIGMNFELIGKYEMALETYNSILPLVLETEDIQIIADIYNYIGSVLIKLKRYDEAESQIKKSLAASKSKSIYEAMENSYQLLHGMFAEIRDFEKAYYYLQLNKEIHDSLNYSRFVSELAKETAKATSELQVNLEVEKKNNDFLKLEQEHEQQKTLFFFLIIILICFILFFILFIFLYRTIRKSNRSLNSAYLDLKDKDNKLLESLAMRDKFFRVIAHDLKTPLGIFKNLSDYITANYKEMSDEDVQQFLFDMKRTSKNLNSLLDNLLLWSKIHTGMQKIVEERFDLGTVVKRIVSEYSHFAAKKDLIITSAVSDGLIVKADLSMVYTIIKNLTTNAIKFTGDKGSINIITKAEDNNAVFVIADSGVGISDDRKGKLFGYERNKTYGTNMEPGTGLGLLLSKDLAELNNATIDFESQENVGSTFRFTIPLSE